RAIPELAVRRGALLRAAGPGAAGALRPRRALPSRGQAMTDIALPRGLALRRFDLWRFPGTRAVAIAAFLYLYVPIVALVVLSFSAGDSSLARWQGFSIHWYADVLGNSDMLRAIRNSLIVASAATTVGTVIATMAALATSGPRFRLQAGVEAMIGLPLIVPD